MAMKTWVLRDDRIPDDRFVYLEPESTFDAYAKKHGDKIAKWYETGRIIVLDNPPIIADDIVSTVKMPQTEGIKELFKSSHALGRDVGDAAHPLHTIHRAKPGDVSLFQQAIVRISEQLERIPQILFPQYQWINLPVYSNSIWRLTEQAAQHMHFDLYNEKSVPRTNHVVRLFWNIDECPRIWFCGENIKDVLKALGLGAYRDREVVKRVNSEYLGCGNSRESSQLTHRLKAPHDLAYIAPNTMWLVHSQYIAHGVMWGRKMLTKSMGATRASMLNPSLLY